MESKIHLVDHNNFVIFKVHMILMYWNFVGADKISLRSMTATMIGEFISDERNIKQTYGYFKVPFCHLHWLEDVDQIWSPRCQIYFS